jgi:hypothetical protein
MKVVEILIQGLLTDGAQHKQWALEEALKQLASKEMYKKLKQSHEWDEGVAP